MSGAPRPAGRWFTDAELAASAAYHRPLHRASVLGAVGDLAAAAAVAALADRWTGEGGTWAAPTVAVATGLVAMRTPHRAALEWWRERGHARASAEEPVGRREVATTIVALVVGRLVGWSLLGLALVGLSRWSAAWPAIAGALGLLGLLAGSVAGPRFAAGWLDQARPLTEAGLRARVDGLAVRAGLGPVPVLEGSGRLARTGEGAYVAGFGRARRLVVDGNLLGPGASADVVDAVVAHELAHWRLGHLRRGVRAGVVAVVLATLVGFAFGRLEPAELPLLDLVLRAGAVAAAPLVAARSRRDEREADAVAAGLVEDGPAAAAGVRRLLLAARTELEPRGIGAVLAHHPPPESRLSVLAAGGRAPGHG